MAPSALAYVILNVTVNDYVTLVGKTMLSKLRVTSDRHTWNQPKDSHGRLTVGMHERSESLDQDASIG